MISKEQLATKLHDTVKEAMFNRKGVVHNIETEYDRDRGEILCRVYWYSVAVLKVTEEVEA